MFLKNNKYFIFCGLLIVSTLNAEEANRGGLPFGELRHSHISSAYTESRASRLRVRALIAETLIGSSVDLSETVTLDAGLIKPNRDLIFINDLEQE